MHLNNVHIAIVLLKATFLSGAHSRYCVIVDLIQKPYWCEWTVLCSNKWYRGDSL